MARSSLQERIAARARRRALRQGKAPLEKGPDYPHTHNKHYPKPDTRSKKPNFDMSTVVAYLNSVPVDGLSGLSVAVDARMKELGIEEDKKALRGLKVAPLSGGNMGSLVVGVQKATKENARDLQQLKAALSARMGLTGFTVNADA